MGLKWAVPRKGKWEMISWNGLTIRLGHEYALSDQTIDRLCNNLGFEGSKFERRREAIRVMKKELKAEFYK